MGKILITGVTGHLGRIVVEKLLSKVPASNVKVLVRDAAKGESFKQQGVEVAIGSYDDKASLVAAFKDVDKLYFISGSDIVNRGKQHENVVNAAKEAKVGHVIYTSFQRKNETTTSPIYMVAATHLLTEKLLQESGLNYTILKHGIYTEMIPLFIGEKVLETGVIFLPAGEGKTAFALRSDFADAAVAVLTGAGHENRSYELTGPEAVSYAEIAAKISAITGKTVSYVTPTPEVFSAELTKAGVPAEYIGLFAAFSGAAKEGEFANVSTDLEKLTGRKGGTVGEYLQQLYGGK